MVHTDVSVQQSHDAKHTADSLALKGKVHEKSILFPFHNSFISVEELEHLAFASFIL